MALHEKVHCALEMERSFASKTRALEPVWIFLIECRELNAKMDGPSALIPSICFWKCKVLKSTCGRHLLYTVTLTIICKWLLSSKRTVFRANLSSDLISEFLGHWSKWTVKIDLPLCLVLNIFYQTSELALIWPSILSLMRETRQNFESSWV